MSENGELGGQGSRTAEKYHFLWSYRDGIIDHLNHLPSSRVGSAFEEGQWAREEIISGALNGHLTGKGFLQLLGKPGTSDSDIVDLECRLRINEQPRSFWSRMELASREKHCSMPNRSSRYQRM